MQLHSHVEAIKQELAESAGLGDEAAGEAARRLAEGLAATLHLHILDLLGEVALELSGQLESGRIEVRLAGRDPELAYVPDVAGDTERFGFGEEHSGRITLRLPESLKAGVEAAALREGISTNAWLVRSLARVLEQQSTKRSRKRIQGYAQG